METTYFALGTHGHAMSGLVVMRRTRSGMQLLRWSDDQRSWVEDPEALDAGFWDPNATTTRLTHSDAVAFAARLGTTLP